MSEDEVTKTLCEALESSDTEIKIAAIKGLSGKRTKKVAEILIPLLKNNDPDIRASAAKALEGTHPIAIEPLIEALTKKENLALGKPGPNWRGDYSVKSWILGSLEHFNDKRVFTAFLDEFQCEKNPVGLRCEFLEAIYLYSDESSRPSNIKEVSLQAARSKNKKIKLLALSNLGQL